MPAAGLPTGTVTFLFTDIEGSTRMLDELGATGYDEALTEHRRIIREACSSQGGVEVDTQGDAFFFAFPTAPAALAAAAELTDDLASTATRVRVGIHTGTPLLGDEGYVGHDVHRAARIAAAGHGGQVVVSASTAGLVDADLRDLGEHRFKDLGASERVYQLGGGAFPTLKSLYRTTLPVPATPFVGRSAELSDAVELMGAEGTRVLTLTGPGGTGKTRLMLQAAAEVSDQFPDGVFWIPLAPLRDASLLETTFAQAVEVGEQPDVAIADSIIAALAGKSVLLVVDNCEHLVDAVADVVRTLVDGCPRLVIVGSSRERLGLRSERVFSVPPMGPTDSETLFMARARAVESDFERDEQVAEICAAVDGLPLAVELAAAHVRSLSTKAILERLAERLSLLTSRGRDLDERQRTLEATISWSYDLLRPDERRALRKLAVFAGGCTLDAAGQVAAADLDLLESLLDKSLLRHGIDEARQDRYWMLETIREYAGSALVAEGERTDTERRHREHFASIAVELMSHVVHGVTTEQLARYRADRANFRVALSGAIDAGDADSALRLLRYLGRIWFDLREAAIYAIAGEALDLDGGDDENRAYALLTTAEFATEYGEIDRAREMFDEAEPVFDRVEDPRGLALLSTGRSYLEMALGNHADAIELAEQAVELASRAGDQYVAAGAKNALAGAVMVQALDTEPPNRRSLERSRDLLEEFLETVRDQGAPLREATAEANLGALQYLLGDLAAALGSSQHAMRLRLAHVTGRMSGEFFNIGCIAADLGQYRAGIMLIARSLLNDREDGVMLHSSAQRDLELIEPAAREALGDERYEHTVHAGESLTQDEAIELALGLEPGQSSVG